MHSITLNLSENDLDVLRKARALSAAADVVLAEFRAFDLESDRQAAIDAYDRWLSLDKQAEREFALFARICSAQITDL